MCSIEWKRYMEKVNLQKRLAPQACPLCGELQDVLVNGHHHASKDDTQTVIIQQDLGYSFCNCRNIFYTDWSNMEQGVYDKDYYKKYDTENIRQAIRNLFYAYNPQILGNLPTLGDTFKRAVLDIGSINPELLDCFSRQGFKTFGMDIHKHPLGDHKLIVSDFEKFDIGGNERFSVIWASHVVEHFKDPIAAVGKVHSILDEGGLLFVAMPDTYFIDWGSPYKWGHWHLKEHHILWDLDCFCELLEEKGFEIIMKRHNPETNMICLADMHILARKR